MGNKVTVKQRKKLPTVPEQNAQNYPSFAPGTKATRQMETSNRRRRERIPKSHKHRHDNRAGILYIYN